MTALADTFAQGWQASIERERELEAELAASRAGRARMLAAAHADGVPVAQLARAAGVSRETAHKLLRSESAWTEQAKRRIAEIDARYEKLVQAIMAREKESAAGVRIACAHKNGQAGKRRRKGLKPLPTPTEELRAFAETKLLRLLADKGREDPILRRIADEIDEAWTLRQRLEALADAAAGI